MEQTTNANDNDRTTKTERPNDRNDRKKNYRPEKKDTEAALYVGTSPPRVAVNGNVKKKIKKFRHFKSFYD